MAGDLIGSLRICSHCILPETFPGIKFDDQGICNYCRKEQKALQKSVEKKAQYRRRLDDLINDIKGKAPLYDAVMAYSGGKDSSYTLKLIKEQYRLKLLAITFDNHFVSPMAWENIRTVTNTLEVDHISFRPPWPVAKKIFSLTAQRDIFPRPTLLRASAVCTSCMGMVKGVVLRTALEMKIPLVAFGWSPGQAPIHSAILKTNPKLIRQNQMAFGNALPEDIRKELKPYFIPEVYYQEYADSFPYNIHPLAFFDYDEEEIMSEMRELGWRPPEDTDTNSTNCLLNAFANQCHIDRHGFHPYVWEIANMVRQGVVDRDEGIAKIYSPQDPDMVKYAKEKLGL